VLSHLEAHQSVDTVLCSPTSSTVHVKCPTSSAVHSPPRRSIRSAPHRRLNKIQYSHRSNQMFPHAITAVVSITSGSVSICVPTWRIVLKVSITVIDLCSGVRVRRYQWHRLPAVTAR
jgi:hypothetical protein